MFFLLIKLVCIQCNKINFFAIKFNRDKSIIFKIVKIRVTLYMRFTFVSFDCAFDVTHDLLSHETPFPQRNV